MVIEKRLEKLRTSGRHGSPAEREANAQEEALLDRLEPELSAGRPLRAVAAQRRRRAAAARLSVPDPEAGAGGAEHRRGTARDRRRSSRPRGATRYAQPQTDVAALGGKIEAELAQLSEDDAALFMEDLGIAEPSRGRVIHLTYSLLGLFSFFTAGEDECRAWTLRQGANAVDAAAAIHSDLARGFIRAEVVTLRRPDRRAAAWSRRASAACCDPRARPTPSATAT